MRNISHLEHLGAKSRIPDAAADQCGIRNDVLTESVACSAQNFVLLRLLHAAPRIITDIKNKSTVITVHNEYTQPGENCRNQRGNVLFQNNVPVGSITFGESFGFLRHLASLDAQEELYNFLNIFI